MKIQKILSKLIYCCYVLCLWALLFVGKIFAQVTTGSLRGTVKNGSVIVQNASLILKNTNTGASYSATADEKGAFVFFDVEPGEYLLQLSSGAGGEEVPVTINLGQNSVYNFDLSSTRLQEITVSGQKRLTIGGASTLVKTKTIMEIPAFNRSIGDIAKLTPQANGLSFAGMNGRFNNMTIDGAVANDLFALGSSGLPGESSGGQPISLDAIGEMQVVLSPYSVQYGNFTGGGVNMITRSGSNKLSGSAYFFTKNAAFTGKDPISAKPTDAFSEYTAGARLGGPIIKNKLFYFVNYEFVHRSQPSLYNVGDGALLSEDSAKWIVDKLKSKFNYDPGAYGKINLLRQSHKAIVKLNYNINSRHKLSLRYSFVTAQNDALDRRQANFSFGNMQYTYHSVQNSVVLKLNSNLGQGISNTLITSYTSLHDFRNIAKNSTYFPHIILSTKNAGTINIGSNAFAQDNDVNQHIVELTDNFKIARGNYTFLVGTHNEFYRIYESFFPRKNGVWYTKQGSISDLDKLGTDNNGGIINRFRTSYDVEPDGHLAGFNVLQLSAYGQVEASYWQNRIHLSLGFRVDVPVFLNKPLANIGYEKQFNLKNNAVPYLPLYSPRFGFNIDPTGKKLVVLRGGVGLFSGRMPFVWIWNAFGNDGLRLATADFRSDIGKFTGDVSKTREVSTDKRTSFSLNSIEPTFRFPQVLRSNFALDFQIPGGVFLTLEGIFSKTLNAPNFRQIGRDYPGAENITPPLVVGKNLSNDEAKKLNHTDTYIGADGKVDPNRSYRGGIYHLLNTNRGYSYSLTTQVRKNFNFGSKAGILGISLAYNYSQAFDITDGSASIAASSYGTTYIPANISFNGFPPLAVSRFNLRHRIISTISYNIPYSQYANTTLFLFLRSNSGSPFSLTYSSYDLNKDGFNNNDLLYIPTDQEIDASKTLSGTEKNNLKNFIHSSKEMLAHQGKYSERNMMTSPWETILDLRILQNFVAKIAGEKHTFQLSLEIFNLTNLLNPDWGRNYSASVASPWGVSGKLNTVGKTNQPWTLKNLYNIDFNSRWQMQLGFRYIF